MTTDAPMPEPQTPVSVIIPTYNHAHFLGGALESVLAQTVPAAEIVVVDDGSTDRPEEIVARYPAVRLIRQPNRGLAAARNSGWRATTAPYLMFLDADDRFRPQAIETALRCIAEDSEAAFSYGGYANVFVATGEISVAQFHPVPKDAFAAFLRVNTIGMHGTVLYRRNALEAVSGFHESLRVCEDYDIYLRLSMRFPVLCEPTVLADYTRHQSNMSDDPAFMLRSVLKVLRHYRAAARARGLMSDYRAGIRGWRGHYVGQWTGMMKRRGPTRATPRQCLTFARLAPITLLKIFVVQLWWILRFRR